MQIRQLELLTWRQRLHVTRTCTIDGGVASWKMSALGKTCRGIGIDANRSKKMKFSNEVMCPHCDKKVALKTFKKHERLYFVDNEWITKASVFTAVPAEESVEPQGNCTT